MASINDEGRGELYSCFRLFTPSIDATKMELSEMLRNTSLLLPGGHTSSYCSYPLKQQKKFDLEEFGIQIDLQVTPRLPCVNLFIGFDLSHAPLKLFS